MDKELDDTLRLILSKLNKIESHLISNKMNNCTHAFNKPFRNVFNELVKTCATCGKTVDV